VRVKCELESMRKRRVNREAFVDTLLSDFEVGV
jgi:hypothetical protein